MNIAIPPRHEWLLKPDVLNEITTSLPIGLLHGGTGMAIPYFLLGQTGNDNRFREAGQHILDHLSDHIATVKGHDLAQGLAGIGWMIEWLAQHDLLKDIDTDDILEEVDDVIYNSIVYGKDPHVSLQDGLLGKIIYFDKRMQQQQPGYHAFKQLPKLECLILLTDDLAERIATAGAPFNAPALLEDGAIDEALQALVDLGDTLRLIGKLSYVNQPVMESILYTCATVIDQTLKTGCWLLSRQHLPVSGPLAGHLLHLAACYLLGGKKHQRSYWQSRAIGYLDEVQQYVPSFQSISHEQAFPLLTTCLLLQPLLPERGFNIRTQQLLDHLLSQNHPYTIINGWGALILAQLYSTHPELVNDWDELLLIM